MYSGVDDPQFNFIDAQTGKTCSNIGYSTLGSDDQLQQPAPLASFSRHTSFPVSFQHPNLNSVTADKQDLDSDAGRVVGYPHHYIPSFSDQPQLELHPSGNTTSGEGPSSSQLNTFQYPNIDAYPNYHNDYGHQYTSGNDSQMPLSYPNINIHMSYHEDSPPIFSNVSSLHLAPFDSHADTMLPDPNVDARTSYYDYSTGEDLPAATASTSSHSIASYFPSFYAPFQSADGVSTMPDSEDVMPLGQPLPVDKPLSFDAPCLKEPLSTSVRPSGSRKHCQDCFIAFDPRHKKIRGWAPATSAEDISNVKPSAPPSQPLVAGSKQPTSEPLPGVGPVEYDESHPIHKYIIQKALDIIITTVINGNPFLSKEA
ncbi:uncharacterized protein EDB93DRAFT_1106719 [Suillus bovinus]|uniref:uncharacterized protein n=1 Tax=Suillus bovinus TaxID=48563 RepID=UPI001B8713D4|nr:uncharacterized protein EDB93DRAFT_1106719 [Suillus bovinus]KAG2136921.1 hypothetical protein EDB93DRAFT_1106719 [Suillus bovinus]